jgi:hypothetical protein
VRSARGRLMGAVAATLVAIAGVLWRSSPPLAGQGSAGPTKSAPAWSAPRTPWGEPDLQGLWSNFDDTPFERPNQDAATVARERAVVKRLLGPEIKTYVKDGASVRDEQRHESPVSPRRPSLVVDPPEGRVPLLPGAATYRNHDLYALSWANHSVGERCITRGVPGVIVPYRYNNGRQILQTPGYVVILSEMIHDARIIPVDGRPHVGPAIRLWNGDPRGRWEGETLVVETTNYNGRGAIRFGTGIVEIPQTGSSRIVERFTRVSERTIDYAVTIEDPRVFVRPWTMKLPFNSDPNYQIYEYACHEGNRRYMEGVLRGGGGLFNSSRKPESSR